MIESVWGLLVVGAVVACVVIALLWVVQLRTRDAMSRHPNYFFEWVTWIGVALVATTAPWGWVGWIVPAVLLLLLFRVTGIPATEAEALRSRADYADYQRTTSVFVPLPPRSP